MKTTSKHNPLTPAKYEIADVSAIQALARGDATKDQQQRALRWIAEGAAAMYDLPYFDGEDGDRDTAFACGKMFVGHQIRKLTLLNIAELQKLDKKPR
jgi:hypothetical protein